MLLVALVVLVLLITTISATIIYSNRVSVFADVRKLLLMSSLLIGIRISLEFLKFVPSFAALGFYYGFFDVLLTSLLTISLTLATLGVYFESPRTGIGRLFKTIFGNKKHASVLIGLIAYSILEIAIFTFFKTYDIIPLRVITGEIILEPVYPREFEIMVALTVSFLLFYSAPLIAISYRRDYQKGVKESLLGIFFSWIWIALVSIIFDFYQFFVKIDMTLITYLIVTILFSFGAISFSRVSMFATLDSKQDEIGSVTTSLFSKRIRKDLGYLIDKQFLMESDLNSSIDVLIRDFCTEQLSQDEIVFITTSISSSLYKSLANYQSIRFLLMTQKVSYAKPGEKENEILIPQDGITGILDVIEREVRVGEKGKVTLIIDNLTDMFVTVGQTNALKFLRVLNEFIANNNMTSLLVLYPGGLDEKTIAWIRSLYSNILAVTSNMLKITKEQF